MIQANLIPAPMLDARRRRARLRAWLRGLIVYALALAAGYFAFAATWSYCDDVLESDSERVAGDIAAARMELAQVQPKLQAAQLTLEASAAVGSQPDWSLLLALLADRRTDDLVFSGCELAPIREVPGASPEPAAPSASAAAASPAAAPLRYIVRLKGFGLTQASISQFVLRIEQTELFDRVTLVESKRAAYGGGDAVAFHLDCLLSGAQAAKAITSGQ